ncbi:BatD family protein [Desulfogranum marinum]|uniref:BatD family protein n=1 Tax=Desulfogranum marinum TaxID=453220 RepID=UPI0029C74625|nr:BatD family protein [Desulfogranum marinum]
MVNRLSLSLFLLFLSLCVFDNAFGGLITARVDRNPIVIDESVTYQLIINDPSGKEPDFSPLNKDFEILAQGSSTNMQIINGTSSRSKQYQLSLMAKRIGKLTIPPIAVGKEQSNAVELIVTTAQPSGTTAGNQDFFLEVRATPEKPFVRSQVLLTVRLYVGASLASGSLSEPEPENTTVHKLGDAREYTTTRNGRNYRVNERRYALFPQQPGQLVIPPLLFHGQVGTRSTSFFDPFPKAGATKRIRSKELRLEVKQKPAQATLPWLPSQQLTGKMELNQTTGEIRAGEPITINFAINAAGLPAARLPEPKLPLDKTVRLYPDQANFENTLTDRGLTGVLTQKITLIPSQAGEVTLAPQPISWWNTTTNTLQQLSFEPLTLQVLPPIAPVRAPIDSPAQIATPISPEKVPAAAPQPFWTKGGGWFWTSIVLACCWLLTLIAWWKKGTAEHSRDFDQATDTNNTAAIRTLEKQLHKACAAGEAEAARKLLNQLTTSQETRGALQDAVAQLNAYLYGGAGNGNQWDGTLLWQAWKNQHRQNDNTTTSVPSDGLRPLYQNGLKQENR